MKHRHYLIPITLIFLSLFFCFAFAGAKANESSDTGAIESLLAADSGLTVKDNTYLTGISDKTTVSSLLGKFTSKDSVRIINDKNTDITSSGDALAGTGMKLQSVDNGGNLTGELTLVVCGDTTGDGKITVVDCMKLRANQLGKSDGLADAYLEAGLDIVPGSSVLKVVHYMKLRAYQLGKITSFDSPVEEKFVLYSEFGAVGDGRADDFTAIKKTHDYANSVGLKVKADAGAKYYIGKSSVGAEITIRTNVDFGDAEFIIDDSFVTSDWAERGKSIFIVESNYEKINITELKALKKNQASIPYTPERKSLIYIEDSSVKMYIRKGVNQNSGDSKNDFFIVDKNGVINETTKPLWNFDKITTAVVYPIDAETLTLTGGIFKTIANNAESKYTYYARNILIKRSNVEINNLTHLVVGEGAHGAPYRGFITTEKCCNITLNNCLMTPHLTYITTESSGGGSVKMGSYDISAGHTINLTLNGCKQTVSITNKAYWGIFASNYSRNIVFDGCELSRFDAHTGVCNVTIKNCKLGHQGINLTGFGTALIENTSVNASSFICFRGDYGSTWNGDLIIKDCTFKSNNAVGAYSTTSLFACGNDEQHNFGYNCTLPKNIILENFTMDDTLHTSPYKGVYLFGNYNPNKSSKSFIPVYAYTETESITIIGFKSLAGMKWRLCPNAYLFQNAIITEE